MKAGVDDFHASVTQRACHDLCAPIVAVEAGLCDDHTDRHDGTSSTWLSQTLEEPQPFKE
jgi:hypothetical protein